MAAQGSQETQADTAKLVRPGFGSLTVSFPPHPGGKHITKASLGLGEGLTLTSQGDK